MNEKEKQLRKIFEQIEQYNDGKHDNKIIKLCDEGLEIDNKHIGFYLYKAEALHNLGKYNNNTDYHNEAIKYFNDVINILSEKEKNIKDNLKKLKLYNLYGEIYNNIGSSYLNLLNYNKALEYFNKSIEYGFTHAGVYYNRGVAYYNIAIENSNYINNFESAIEDFNKAKELGFYNNDIYFYKGSSYFNLGKEKSDRKIYYLNNTIENLDKFINFNNNHYNYTIKAYYVKALAYSYLLMESNSNLEYYFNKSIENFNMAIKNNIECGEYYYNRGLCYYNFQIKKKKIENNNFELSIKDLNKALELGFNNKEVYFSRGLSYFYLATLKNNYEYVFFSIKDFNIVINSDANNGEAYFYRGLSYYKLEEFDNCIKDLKKSIELNFYNKDIFLYISSSYFNLQNYEESINNINKFIKENYDSEIGYLNRAINYIHLYIRKDKNYNKYYDIIEKDFYKAIELKPNDEFILSKMGGFYYILGHYDKCLNQFNKIIEINEENDSPYYYKGLCYYNLKNYDEAIKNYNISEKYCKSYHNKLSIQNRKIEVLLKLEKKENDIFNLYQNVILELYKQLLDEEVFYTYDLFNILSSIYRNLLHIKNKIDINETEIIFNTNKVIKKLIQDDFCNEEYYYRIKSNSLYNYTRINKNTLKSILNNTLWCSNTKNFNDPVDPFIKKNRYDKSYYYLLDRMKVACLTIHNDNTLMWSHYADKHQGICIEYDIIPIFNKDNIILKKIGYHKKIVNFDIPKRDKNKIKIIDKNIISNVLIDNNIINHIIDLFTVKSKEWEYEDEFRILFYDEKNENPNGTLINLPIKSICFGVQTSKEDKELVYNIVNSINKKNKNKNTKKYKRIKLYQAELDDNELFKINIKPYEHKKN